MVNFGSNWLFIQISSDYSIKKNYVLHLINFNAVVVYSNVILSRFICIIHNAT